MDEQEKDPQLGPPQEANTGKHINFLEAEEDSRNSDRTANTDDQSPTKKAWEELRSDSRSDKSKNDDQ